MSGVSDKLLAIFEEVELSANDLYNDVYDFTIELIHLRRNIMDATSKQAGLAKNIPKIAAELQSLKIRVHKLRNFNAKLGKHYFDDGSIKVMPAEMKRKINARLNAAGSRSRTSSTKSTGTRKGVRRKSRRSS